MHEELDLTATYSPEDNKLRLYAATRLDADTYASVKAAGFIWAPKQQLFVAPMWTPERADLLEELAGEIGDEDTSLVDRTAERAERFEHYSENRSKDAQRAHAAVERITDGIPMGQPILVGHHSERHARKDAQRIENGMRKTVKMWQQSKYWTDRAHGAIRAAKYKERPDVRNRRIKGLEADKRREEKGLAESLHFLRLWADDCANLAKKDGSPSTFEERAAYLCRADNTSRCFLVAEYPRPEGASSYEGMMDIGQALKEHIITASQARQIAEESHGRWKVRAERWIEHLNNRLAYERAMLAESGYTPPPQKPSRAVLPLLNYSGEVCYRNQYGGGNITTQAVGITKAEFAKIHDDYKGTFISSCGTHRVRSTMLGRDRGGLCVVYLTDSKQHPRPSAEAIEAKAQEEAHAAAERTAQRRPAMVPPNPPPVANTEPAGTLNRAAVEAMQDTLRAGVQVVATPQLFPTPPQLAARMVTLADIRPDHRVLEPSAGTGNLLRAIGDQPDKVAVEISPALVQRLASLGVSGLHVHQGDFLSMDAELGTFDRIIMNPPFQNGADIRHIEHARRLLRPGGRLVALCADGPRQKTALRPFVSRWLHLDPGTFKESGTMVNVALLVIDAAKNDLAS